MATMLDLLIKSLDKNPASGADTSQAYRILLTELWDVADRFANRDIGPVPEVITPEIYKQHFHAALDGDRLVKVMASYAAMNPPEINDMVHLVAREAVLQAIITFGHRMRQMHEVTLSNYIVASLTGEK